MSKTKATKSAQAPKAAPAKKAEAMANDNGEAKAKKVSALDAAAQVLTEAGKPMNAKDMIAAMAEKGLWTSPGGKTPHSTLYAAILTEINKKGETSRFAKADRGHFASKA